MNKLERSDNLCRHCGTYHGKEYIRVLATPSGWTKESLEWRLNHIMRKRCPYPEEWEEIDEIRAALKNDLSWRCLKP